MAIAKSGLKSPAHCGRGRRILHDLKSKAKSPNSAKKGGFLCRRRRSTPAKKVGKCIKKGKLLGTPSPSPTHAKVQQSANNCAGLVTQLSPLELAAFRNATKCFLNTEAVKILAPLYPPAACYRIIATAIELSQRSGIEAAFYKYLESRERSIGEIEPVSIAAAIVSVAAKLEGAFLWAHLGDRGEVNDVPMETWAKIVDCNVVAAKTLEWTIMHALYNSSSSDCDPMATLFGPNFDTEWWAKYSHPHDID